MKGYDPRNCPDWYREELDRFMAENPELELEEAADPKRLVNIFNFCSVLVRLAKKILAGEIGKTKLEATNVMLIVDDLFEIRIYSHKP